MKMWKRCVAAVLALGIWGSSIQVGMAAGTWDYTNETWSASAAEVVAENFGMDAKKTAVLKSSVIKQGQNYQSNIPYGNDNTDREDLVAVDYLNKIIYAKKFESDGYTWLPEEAVLTADGADQETMKLSLESCSYEDESYDASVAFDYTGHEYEVQVTYRLYVTISAEEQTRLYRIPFLLGTVIQNLEKQLKSSESDLRNLGSQLAALNTIVADAEDCEDEQKILNDLYNEYTAGSGLALYNLSRSYKEAGTSRLAFAFAHGQEVQEASEQLYEQLYALKNSTTLKTFYKNLKTEDPDQASTIQTMYTYINALLGNNWAQGPLIPLKKSANWELLEDGVADSILKMESLADLETTAYGLLNVSLSSTPNVTDEQLLAAERKVKCSIKLYDITVNVTAQVADGEENSKDLKQLTSTPTTITLLKGSSADEILAAIEASGVENRAVASWNELSDTYNIDQNGVNYTRSSDSLPSTLTSDITDYKITYTPKTFTVKTNYTLLSQSLPYGYRMVLPIHENEDESYDYTINTADGISTLYDQGVVYTITEDASITRTEGTAKIEYQLYSIVAGDVDYGLSEKAQAILNSAALNSPSLKLRAPDASKMDSIEEEDGTYTLKCKTFDSTRSNMTWIPVSVTVMNGNKTVTEMKVGEDGSVSWENGNFTHVLIDYELEIKNVSSWLKLRSVDAEEILTILNLPYTLVQEVTAQQEVLSGDQASSAKSLYTSASKLKSFMTTNTLNYASGLMQSNAGKNAVARLLASEDTHVKGQDGKDLGCGGWSNNSDELALYKYLSLCEQSNWSLASYYQNEYYEKIAEQATVLSECLKAIIDDPGSSAVLNLVDPNNSYSAMIPLLKKLAENVAPPNEAMNTESPAFSSLITNILNAKDDVKTYDEATVTTLRSQVQIVADTAIVLTVGVQVGDGTEKTDSLIYERDASEETTAYHIFTEEEATALQNKIDELEELTGITEDEKSYYQKSQSVLPAAGDHLSRSQEIHVVYTPKTYTVTIKGVSKSQQTFRYGSDYTISLPAKSTDAKSGVYYVYTIDGNTIQVDNGTSQTYAFKKEDLLRLFPNGSYEITREQKGTETKKTETKKTETTKKEEDEDEDDDSTSTSTSTSTTTSTDTAVTATTQSGDTEDTTATAAVQANGDAAQTVTEEPEEEETTETVVSTPDTAEGTTTTKKKTVTNTKKRVGSWLGIIPAAIALALAVALYRQRKKRMAEKDYEGAPLVDYNIEDDDE